MSEENKETGLAVPNAQTAVASSNKFDLETLLSGEVDFNVFDDKTKLELMREIMQSEKELEIMALPMVNSRQIVGVQITVHDAVFKTIPDEKTGELKQCVNFLCENVDEPIRLEGGNEIPTGGYFTTLKGSNTFNDIYVMRFQKLRGLVTMPLRGYHFEIEPKWTFAGNPAIVLRKTQEVKEVLKAKK